MGRRRGSGAGFVRADGRKNLWRRRSCSRAMVDEDAHYAVVRIFLAIDKVPVSDFEIWASMLESVKNFEDRSGVMFGTSRYVEWDEGVVPDGDYLI